MAEHALTLNILMFLHVHFADWFQRNWFLPTLSHMYLTPQVTEVQKGDTMLV